MERFKLYYNINEYNILNEDNYLIEIVNEDNNNINNNNLSNENNN